MSIDVGHYSEADNFPNEVQGTMLPQDLRYPTRFGKLDKTIESVSADFARKGPLRTNCIATDTNQGKRGLL